ncbi:MAG: HAD-IIA family hydrolase [bacterium]|nr:HAD-IIA family hydrolase [bacterium]
MKRPGTVRSYLLDIEGVLVRDKSYEPVPGAVDWFARLAASGRPYCLVSNNTTHAPDELTARLTSAGFPVDADRLVGVLDLGRDHLLARGHRRLLWLGHPRLADWWSAAGCEPADAATCEAVVLGVNPDLATADLDAALGAVLERGVDLVSLHRNAFWLDESGRRRLGPGAWAAALAAVGGAGRQVTIGKPAAAIYHEALKRVGTAPTECLFISDDPEADLVTAGRLGMRTAFVLSGKHADHAVLGRLDENDWPDLVCERLADIALAAATGSPLDTAD